MIKVVIDIMAETQNELIVATEQAEQKGVTLSVLNYEGPGGGWPEVELSGDDTAVTDLLREWGFELEEMENITYS
jgi:hypothetical protein